MGETDAAERNGTVKMTEGKKGGLIWTGGREIPREAKIGNGRYGGCWRDAETGRPRETLQKPCTCVPVPTPMQSGTHAHP